MWWKVWKLNLSFCPGSCEEPPDVCSQGGSRDLERADQGAGWKEQPAGAREQPAEELGEPRAAGEVPVTSSIRAPASAGNAGVGDVQAAQPVQKLGCISGSALGRAESRLPPEMDLTCCHCWCAASTRSWLYRRGGKKTWPKWKPPTFPVAFASSVISDNLFGLLQKKREWCRLQYDQTTGRMEGEPGLAFLSLSLRTRGACLTVLVPKKAPRECSLRDLLSESQEPQCGVFNATSYLGLHIVKPVDCA